MIAIFAYCTFMLFGLFGQNSGALSGKVTAASGAPVASASVIVTDSTGFARNAVTAQDGTFTVSGLPPGTYKVDVEIPGYKRLTQESVQVTAGTPVNLQLGLEAGSEQETVAVQGQAPLADDSSDRIAHSYTGRVVGDLPVQDLNYSQLTELMTGISPPTISNNILVDPQRNRTWNTNGQPAEANNFLFDGVENQEPVRDIQIHVPTINSIQQMNLSTSNYDASQGRAAGSLLSSITKSGTNGGHGEFFWYSSNDWFQARNYFDPVGFHQPVYTQNQFGSVANAPIVPNKTFFFISSQGSYDKGGNPTFSTVPTAAFGAGNFSGLPGVTVYDPFTGAANGTGRVPFTNNMIPANLLNPSALAVLSVLPAPNLPGSVDNYFTNQFFRNNGFRLDARVDQRFNDNNLLFLRYGFTYFTATLAPTLGAIVENGGSSQLHSDDAEIGYTHVFGARVFTDIRAGYTYYSNPINPYAYTYNPALFGLTGTNGQLPNISIDGLQPLGTSPTYPQKNEEDNWNIVNNWTYHVFGTDIRFGLDYYQTRADGFQNLLYGPQGGYTFGADGSSIPGASFGPFGTYPNALAAFLLGSPTVAGINPSNFLPSYISRQYGAYVADRINLMSRLTLDLGLRYDVFWPVQPRDHATDYSVYLPGANALAPLTNNNTNGGVQLNKLNFAPRVGLAFRINDRTVVRAGYGLSFWNPNLAFESSIFTPSTNGVQEGLEGGYRLAGAFGTYPALMPAGGVVNEEMYFSPTHVRTPYVQFYNVDIQRDITHGMLIDLAYVGNLGRELPYTWDINAAQPGTGAAGEMFDTLGQTAPVYERGTGYNSNYNSLQVNLTKRFSQGLAFTTAYTYSKALDYGAGMTPFLNNVNPLANYGPANFDRTNVVTFTHNWELPFGAGTAHLNSGVIGHILGPWQLDGILRYASGLPYTPTGSEAICDCPGNTPTANVVAGSPLANATTYPSYYGMFSLLSPYQFGNLAFGEAAPGTFGALGRNSVRAPGFTNYDLSLSRSFVFRERARIQFRAEAYNLTNSSHFGMPVTSITSPNFGLATTTPPGLGARLFQAVVRVIF